MSSIGRAIGVAAVVLVLAIAGLRHPAAPAFRWLPGLVARAISTDRSSDAVERLAPLAAGETRCPVFDAQEVSAELPPARGEELVLASIPTGVVVLDAAGRRIASASLGACGGSVDEIVAIAVGDAGIGAPVIAVVSSTGGHRGSETLLSVFRLDRRGLTRLFAEPLEVRDGEDLWTGEATLLFGTIVYRAPTGEVLVRSLRGGGTETAPPPHDAV